uniref:ZP domain-containing protein n=1 Tax=Panagrellus redivivus TaxID=6233 RepID=A0A7E4VYW4_PANRE
MSRINMGPLLLLACILVPAVYGQAIPTTATCDAESTPVFLLQHNTTSGIQLRSLPVNNFLDCSEYCANSNECIGVEYAQGQCNIIGASEDEYVSVAEAAPLAVKSCVKSSRVCASPFHFDVHEQKILVGFAREVVPATSLQVCLSACLNAFDSFGFECESIMYYPIDEECILNTEDRLDRPDLFVDEVEDTVIYMDNNCAGSQCYAPYITQYIAVEGKQLHDELDRQFTDLDLEACEELCTQRLTVTVNDFNCKSFMYNNETRTCILSDERSTPLGRGKLAEAKGFTYFEKKCFASPRTCRNTPAFTRVPQMILVGFAAFVMENVPSVTMCLDQCTNPPPETGENFVCKSVMYYYNEQECILNSEARASKPDLFIPEGEDFLVDYFDITCHHNAEGCPAGKSLAAVKTINSALPEGDGSLHVIESAGNSVGDCLAKCVALAPEKCRSFNFDKSTELCNLLYLDGKTTLRPVVKKGIDLVDMHCLAAPTDCPLAAKEGAQYSRYLYTKQTGLSSQEYPVTSLSKCLEICATAERCEGVNYNRRNGNCALFEQIEHASVQADDHIDFYKNLCQVKEVDNGASASVNVPASEHLANVNGSSSASAAAANANSKTQAAHTKDSRTEVLGTKTVKPTIKERGDERRKPEASAESSGNSAGATLSVANSGPPAVPVLIPTEAVQTICNYEGIKVQIKNNEPFTGVIFVKNRYDTCRVEIENSDSATLVLGLPSNFGMKPIVLNNDVPADATTEAAASEAEATTAAEHDGLSSNEVRRRREAQRECGLVDMDNGTYKTTVVVQTNNLGIPGLVTSMDQLYEVSCDYSSMLGGKITAAANLSVTGPEPSLIQPRGKIELGNPVLMQMNPVEGGAGGSVLQAKLGDILELKWEIMAMDEELDFFVKDCVAEAGGAERRGDERLQLIEAGCPTPAVAQKLIPGPIQQQSSAVKIAHLQAFRFDSSSTVRITCQLEICKGNCQSVQCDLADGPKESWGRKKRASDNSVTELETKRYKVPRFAHATTSLVIVDPLQQITEPAAPISRARHEDFEVAAVAPSVSVELASGSSYAASGEICLNKWTLVSVFGLLSALILVQATVVLSYIFKRIAQNQAIEAAKLGA